MARVVGKIIEILDGTPAEYGKHPRGQSAVEMAFITPLLIILFASMVEIGWFANNYLTLLDASRAGARIATGLQGTRSPLQWDNRASLVPDDYLTGTGDAQYKMPDESGSDQLYRDNYRPALFGNAPRCRLTSDADGFYNEVACQTINSLDPLPFRNTDTPDHRATDDVVVSAFAVQTLLKGTDIGSGPIPATEAVVVGRYPTNANECQVDSNGNLLPSGQMDRDPFDFNNNGKWDVSPSDLSTDATVLGYQQVSLPVTGPDGQTYYYEEIAGFDPAPASAANAEKQVGFSWYGNHRIAGTGCIGSEWKVSQVESLINAPSFFSQGDADTQSLQRGYMPSQGIVMVELFWEHTPLLNLPFFEPVYRVFQDRTTIDVWAAFPLPNVEPFILFPPPSCDVINVQGCVTS